MNPFAWSGLLAGVTSFCLGSLVYLKCPNRKIGKIWFIFTIAVAAWGFGGVWIALARTAQEGLMAWRLTYAFGVIWIPALFYHFVSTFLELNRRRTILIHYLIAIAFLPIIPTALFFRRVRWVFDSFFYCSAGTFYSVYFVWWSALVLYSHYQMLQVHKTASSSKKKQIKYFFLATAIGYAGGITTYLPKFGFDVYPWGNFAIFLYPLIMSYAICCVPPI